MYRCQCRGQLIKLQEMKYRNANNVFWNSVTILVCLPVIITILISSWYIPLTLTSPLQAVHHHQTSDHHLEDEGVGQHRVGAVGVLLLLLLLAGGVVSTALCRWRQVEQHQVEVLQHWLAEWRQLCLQKTTYRESERMGSNIMKMKDALKINGEHNLMYYRRITLMLKTILLFIHFTDSKRFACDHVVNQVVSAGFCWPPFKPNIWLWYSGAGKRLDIWQSLNIYNRLWSSCLNIHRRVKD